MHIAELRNENVVDQNSGFVQIPNFIINCGEILSNSAFRLYCSLTSYCYGNRTKCFPKQVTLAQCLGLKSEESVRRLTQELVKLNMVKVDYVKLAKGQTKVVYTLIRYKDTVPYKLATPQKYGVPTPQKYGVPTPQKYGPNNTNSNNTKYNNNINININSVSCKTHSLFNTDNFKLKYMQDELKKLNKNKHRLRCAKLRVQIASMTNNWKDVTNRDFSYYFKDVMYVNKYGSRLKVNNYFTSDIGKFISDFNIHKDDVIPVLQYILDNYELIQTEQYPVVTQLLFSQRWLLKKLVDRYFEIKNNKPEKIEVPHNDINIDELKDVEGVSIENGVAVF